MLHLALSQDPALFLTPNLQGRSRISDLAIASFIIIFLCPQRILSLEDYDKWIDSEVWKLGPCLIYQPDITVLVVLVCSGNHSVGDLTEIFSPHTSSWQKSEIKLSVWLNFQGLSPCLADHPFIPMSSHGLSFVCVWVPISSSYKDTSGVQLWLTPMTSCNLHYLKTIMLSAVRFWVTGH